MIINCKKAILKFACFFRKSTRVIPAIKANNFPQNLNLSHSLRKLKSWTCDWTQYYKRKLYISKVTFNKFSQITISSSNLAALFEVLLFQYFWKTPPVLNACNRLIHHHHQGKCIGLSEVLLRKREIIHLQITCTRFKKTQ